jgi:hypothetical protein
MARKRFIVEQILAVQRRGTINALNGESGRAFGAGLANSSTDVWNLSRIFARHSGRSRGRVHRWQDKPGGRAAGMVASGSGASPARHGVAAASGNSDRHRRSPRMSNSRWVSSGRARIAVSYSSSFLAVPSISPCASNTAASARDRNKVESGVVADIPASHCSARSGRFRLRP